MGLQPDNLNQRSDAADPRLESLLDEALAPEQPSAEMTEQIIAGTRYALRRGSGGVLARLGERPWARTLAATIVVAASVGVIILGIGIVRDAHTYVTIRGDLQELVAVSSQIDQLEQPTAAVEIAAADSEVYRQGYQDWEVLQIALDQGLADQENRWPETEGEGPMF